MIKDEQQGKSEHYETQQYASYSLKRCHISVLFDLFQFGKSGEGVFGSEYLVYDHALVCYGSLCEFSKESVIFFLVGASGILLKIRIHGIFSNGFSGQFFSESFPVIAGSQLSFFAYFFDDKTKNAPIVLGIEFSINNSNQSPIYRYHILYNANYMKEKINELKINEKLNKFINSYPIPFTLLFCHNSNIFEIKSKKENLQDNISIIKGKSKTRYLLKTIDAFIKVFPNLVKYQIYQDENTLELIEKLKLPEKIDDYIKIIKTNLDKVFNDNQQTKLAQKRIYDYIMTRIYDKIFPQTEEEDDKLYQKCIILAWIEPKHFIDENKIFNLENIKNDFQYFMSQIEQEKSPSFKFSNLRKIFKLINDSAEFYGQEIEENDDTLKIFLYLLIKEQPTKLYSNSKYMNLFLSYKQNIEEKKELNNFLSLCYKIKKIDYSNLSNINKEEYILKCREASLDQAK